MPQHPELTPEEASRELVQALENGSAETISTMIRTRLLPTDPTRKYAKPSISDLSLGLSLDSEYAITNLTDQQIAKLPLSLEELFRIGQNNTDNESIDEHFEIDQGIYGLAGESVFIGSKAAKLKALTPIIGETNNGLIFTPLNDSLLLYRKINKQNWQEDTISFYQTVQAIANDLPKEFNGNILDPYTHYWAPDATIERIIGHTMLLNGEEYTPIIPGPAFGNYIIKAD